MFVVRIDHLTDDQLEFFGFFILDRGSEFSIYIEPRTATEHVVANQPPRYLVVDDVNDAIAMSAPGVQVIVGPVRH